MLASFRRAVVPQARRFLDQVLQLVVLALGLLESLLVVLGCALVVLGCALGGGSVVHCIVVGGVAVVWWCVCVFNDVVALLRVANGLRLSSVGDVVYWAVQRRCSPVTLLWLCA